MQDFHAIRQKRAAALKESCKAANITLSQLADKLLPRKSKKQKRNLAKRLRNYAHERACAPIDLLIQAAPLLGIEQPSKLYIEMTEAERKTQAEPETKASPAPGPLKPNSKSWLAKARGNAFADAMSVSDYNLQSLARAMSPDDADEARKLGRRLQNYKLGRNFFPLQLILQVAQLLGLTSYKQLYVRFSKDDDKEIKALIRQNDRPAPALPPAEPKGPQNAPDKGHIRVQLPHQPAQTAQLRYDPHLKQIVSDKKFVRVNGNRKDGFSVTIDLPLSAESILELVLD